MANTRKVDIDRDVEETKKGLRLSSEAPFDMQGEKTTAHGTGNVFDLTLPGKRKPYGHQHPITQTINEIKRIFCMLGFAVEYGPEVEQEYYNFDALNVPQEHPSREDFDTFYLGNKLLLRSQTSTVQIRIMEKKKPPIRMIAPGSSLPAAS